MSIDEAKNQVGNTIPEGELPPKHINNTTELDEIQNHVGSILSLLETLRLKSMFIRQRQQISLARGSIEDFRDKDMKAVKESFEG